MNIINIKNSFFLQNPWIKSAGTHRTADRKACCVLDTADIIGLRTHHKPDTVS